MIYGLQLGAQEATVVKKDNHAICTNNPSSPEGVPHGGYADTLTRKDEAKISGKAEPTIHHTHVTILIVTNESTKKTYLKTY